MGRRSSRGSGIPCAASCYSLARNVRRLGGYPLARPGRRYDHTVIAASLPRDAHHDGEILVHPLLFLVGQFWSGHVAWSVRPGALKR